MKVRFEQDYKYRIHNFKKGQERQVANDLGAFLIEKGIAVVADDTAIIKTGLPEDIKDFPKGHPELENAANFPPQDKTVETAAVLPKKRTRKKKK